LATRDYLAGAYSIADMACFGWARAWERQGQDISEFPHFKRWLERVTARPAVQRGVALRVEEAGKVDIAKDKEAWKLLFTQGARS
jgi:GST-like protein